MTTRSATWHGTTVEWEALANAAERNCSCVRDGLGRVLSRCAAHEMIERDQRALDGLLFARHIASRLIQEELADGDPPESGLKAVVTPFANPAWAGRR